MQRKANNDMPINLFDGLEIHNNQSIEESKPDVVSTQSSAPGEQTRLGRFTQREVNPPLIGTLMVAGLECCVAPAIGLSGALNILPHILKDMALGAGGSAVTQQMRQADDHTNLSRKEKFFLLLLVALVVMEIYRGLLKASGHTPEDAHGMGNDHHMSPFIALLNAFVEAALVNVTMKVTENYAYPLAKFGVLKTIQAAKCCSKDKDKYQELREQKEAKNNLQTDLLTSQERKDSNNNGGPRATI